MLAALAAAQVAGPRRPALVIVRDWKAIDRVRELARQAGLGLQADLHIITTANFPNDLYSAPAGALVGVDVDAFAYMRPAQYEGSHKALGRFASVIWG